MEPDSLLQPFERLLAEAAPLTLLRQMEAGAPIDGLWGAISRSGFLDALVAEDAGGAGLALSDVEPLVRALGRALTPAPVAQTIAARALLSAAGVAAPEAPILLAVASADGKVLIARSVPLGAVAGYALVETGSDLVLAALTPSNIRSIPSHRSCAADLCWRGRLDGVAVLARPEHGLRPVAAALRAAEIAGAAERLLQMTVAYANDRIQFGKPIGKLQAIQQQIAVMAEKTAMAGMASQLGCAQGFPPALRAAAIAKQVASAAVGDIVSVAHAVHGAIGVSEAHDLQLFARRLQEWRMADGSESYWARLLGAQRLASDAVTSVDFLRQVGEQPSEMDTCA